MPMKVDIWTYDDLISHALDYMGAAVDQLTERYARRAVQFAMNEMMSKRTWAYYYQIGHFNTVAPYDDGTIEYTHATKTVTLTGGAFPSWAADGVIDIEGIPYPVVSRTSGTAVILADANNPGADVAAGTSYTIYKELFTLPVDLGAIDSIYRMQNGSPFALEYMNPADFIATQAIDITPGEPFFYTITNDPNRHGVLGVRFRPAPVDIYRLNYVYRRRPRLMRVTGLNEGTVAIAANSTTITGFGTEWTSQLVGSIIRISQDTSTIPTGLAGASPFWIERSIVAFTNATSMTLDAVPGETASGRKYSISDPCDIEPGAMLVYLCREIENQCRAIKRMKPASEEELGRYKLAMVQAFEADSRLLQRRIAEHARIWPADSLTWGRVEADA
jgi:hypothetical protein